MRKNERKRKSGKIVEESNRVSKKRKGGKSKETLRREESTEERA